MDAFTEAEKNLNELIAKKRIMDKQLCAIELSIYSLETAYLEETPYGNAIKVDTRD